ncbi:MAG: glycosyltransferase family 2 protein [Pyrinomonadaceae bacterium]|nr:glycosyltransferase family 2 protein [Pyrinomonadaceae bacterium]
MKVYDQEVAARRQVESPRDEEAPEISVFLPVYNEEPNLLPLHAKLDDALTRLGRSAEIIYVDDGSSDGSLKVLREVAERDPRVRVVALKRNYGQTAAMAAGIDAAHGDVLIPMDADLQNDPADIIRLLDKLDEGYDVVSGWRKNRQDKLITRKIPSMIANRLISWIGGVPLHDYGCSLKAYRREALQDVRLYGEMHRFIPIYASWVGARVSEIPVEHHPRTMGKSKYGLSRTLKVVFDLMTIKFMACYQTKPIYVFGSFGMLAFFVSVVAGLYAVFLKLFHKADFVQTPLPILAIVMFAVGIQFLLMGLLAEMLVRTYHESQEKSIYAVRERIGFDKVRAVVMPKQGSFTQPRIDEQSRTNAADQSLEQEFLDLADQWRRETMMMSSSSDIVANPAYQQIIGMGEKAIPLILRELQQTGGHWFWALRAITRKNPVKPEDKGNLKRMAQAWLEWGRRRGHV